MTAPRCHLAVLLTALICPSVLVAKTVQVPDWMASLQAIPLPAHEADATAVQLHAETLLTVREDGRVVRLERKAFRILRADDDQGVVRVPFNGDSPILSLRAWSIPADGKPFEAGAKEAVDSGYEALSEGQLVTDDRIRLLRIPSARPGSLVAYEVEQQRPPYLLVDEWLLQRDVPVMESSYTLRLPEGWSFKASWMNRADVSPEAVSPREWRWKLGRVDPIAWEASMPPWEGLASRMIVALVPPAGRATGGFQSWRDLGSWYLALTRGRPDASDAIRAKVRLLTATSPSLADRIQAVARYVQNDIRYVGIQLGVGGFQPHPAADVFTHGYGDCKDKSTLLASMLRELGIESSYVLVNSERGVVTAATPAHNAFDHVILAIHVPADASLTSLPAAATHPTLGRILYFDPTHTLVPFGRLPGPLQGSFGLFVAPQGGDLVQLPLAPFDSNGVTRTAKMTLDEAGNLRGEIIERFDGETAVGERGRVQYAARDTDRVKTLESRLSRSLAAFEINRAAVGGVAAVDRPVEWRYTLEAPAYAKALGDLVLVRPRVLGTLSSDSLEASVARRHPIQFAVPSRYSDVFEIALPAGMVVEELPAAVNVDLGYAAYHSQFDVVDSHTLRYRRTFDLKDVTVPASQAEELRKLYRAIDADEKVSAVLRRKS